LAVRISLRVKLSIWYSVIVVLSLLAYGAFTYFSVSRDLHTNLDASLTKVAASLDFIIQKNESLDLKNLKKKPTVNDKFKIFRESEKMRFVGPLRPSLVSKMQDDAGNDIVWSAIYEHILMNPKNYYIQISDTNNLIIWRSKNLQNDSLPKLNDIHTSSKKDTISLHNVDTVIKLTYNKDMQGRIDSLFQDITIHNEDMRLLVKRTDNAVISIGYVVSEVKSTLYQLFMVQVIAFPFILIISVIGGLVLSKLSLRPIDELAESADEITAKNLSRRLPEVYTNDEVGHLTHTLNRMIERLDTSFTQIKKFTSDASHELRTPLTILQGELEIALHSLKTPLEYEHLVISSLEEVARLTNVVETLLELSRAESGQIKMNLIEGDLSKLVRDIAEDAEILAESKGIVVETSIDDNIIIPYDSARMHQAFLNIVDNAIKYTINGKVFIILKKNKDFAEIIVKDTGVGIPDDELPHIFDRLYRVEKSRSSDIQGAGLGLSIVKWIVEGHNGKINVESLTNSGTTFIIKIPFS